MLYDCKGKYLDLKEQALQERTLLNRKREKQRSSLVYDLYRMCAISMFCKEATHLCMLHGVCRVKPLRQLYSRKKKQ